MKKIAFFLLLVCNAVLLSSCRGHLFNIQFNVPIWLPILIVAAVFIISSFVIAEDKYVCTKCGHKFKPKWYKCIFSLNSWDSRVFKCPHCGHKGLFPKSHD